MADSKTIKKSRIMLEQYKTNASINVAIVNNI